MAQAALQPLLPAFPQGPGAGAVEAGVGAGDREQRQGFGAFRHPGLEHHIPSRQLPALNHQLLGGAARDRLERRLLTGPLVSAQHPEQDPFGDLFAFAAEMLGVVEQAQVAFDHLGAALGIGCIVLLAHHRGGHGEGGDAEDADFGQLETAGRHRGVLVARGCRSLRSRGTTAA